LTATAQTVWRASWQSRLLALLLYAVASIVALAAVSAGATVDDKSNLVFLPISGLIVCWGSAVAFRARVKIDSGDLVVVNTLTQYRVPLSSIQEFQSARRSNLWVVMIDGSTHACWAIQATNISRWLGRPTRVDRVAVQVRELTKGQLGTGPMVPIARRWTGFAWHGWLLAVGFQMLGILWLIGH